jgi:hypothetical protein
MAGAITHLLVAERALEQAKVSVPDLRVLLDGFEPFVLLGSVSPDLPYLNRLSPRQSVWADQMHYSHTNLLAMRWAVDIGSRNIVGRPEGKAELAWVAGFIAHCVADATIHPVVQAIVGPYHANPDEHRACEMTQDSLLFSKLKGCDLCGSQFVDTLKRCGPEALRDNILDLWTWPLQGIYPRIKPAPKPRAWYSFYTTLLDGAVDSDLLAGLSRIVKGVQTYLYLSAARIRADRPEEARRYYDEIPVPNRANAIGSFFEDAFSRTVENIVEVWSALWADVQNANVIGDSLDTAALGKVMKNWDLDTGADMDQPDPRVSFWPVA